ncbi:hypothetical protein [Glycomyces sp. MUSA5-2]|uniref:hypothetical protein n=1 Tax=Glycomyces sp. MUSA5-2 TaxID=2053002 RepID=UPI00300A7A79
MSQTPPAGPAAASSEPDPAPDLAAFMRDFRQRMTELHERAEPVRHLIDATCDHIESPGHEAVLTVTATGELVGIEFLPPAEKAEPADLAAAIIATYDRAAAGRPDPGIDVLVRALRRIAHPPVPPAAPDA